MKPINQILFILGLILTVYACSPEEPGPIGEPANKVSQLSGTWQISKVLQVDLAAEQKGFPTIAKVRDITNALPGMPYTDAKFTFNTAGSNPGTFQIEKGNSLLQLPSTGNWNFNDPNYPSAVVLSADGGEQVLEIASFAEIQSGVLVFKTERSTPEGRPYVRYEYYLNRVSE